MTNRFTRILLAASLLAVSALIVTASPPQNSPCEGLIAAVRRAQGDYNRAQSARMKAESDLNRGKNNVKSIVGRIKANEAQQNKAEAAEASALTTLEKAKKDAAGCRRAA